MAKNVMMFPPIEELMERTHSKFALVALAARRARDLTEYQGKGGVSRSVVPQQVSSSASKPLSIAFEEIAAGKVIAVPIPVEPIADGAADGESAAPTADAQGEEQAGE
jgi:DNA-directed RNA polymerase subunit omega